MNLDFLIYLFVGVFVSTLVLVYILYIFMRHGDTKVPLISTMAAKRPQSTIFEFGMAISGLLLQQINWSIVYFQKYIDVAYG